MISSQRRVLARKWLGSTVVAAGLLLGSQTILTQPVAAAESAANCPAATVTVATTDQLKNALKNANAGTVIRLSDGTYRGGFAANNRRGTAQKPIWICGSRSAKIDNGGDSEITDGLTVENSSYVNLQGFTVQNVFRGVNVLGSDNIRVDNLRVTNIGQEGIHLQRNTRDSVVSNNDVSHTGRRRAITGEGIYIGSSPSSFSSETGGWDQPGKKPDRTRNIDVLNNRVSDYGPEAIEIKAGTSDGVVAGNTINGQNAKESVRGAIWITGNNWQVKNNRIDFPRQHAIRIQQYQEKNVGNDWWGKNNVVEGNQGNVNNKANYGVDVHVPNINGAFRFPPGLIVRCNNKFDNVKRLMSPESKQCGDAPLA